MTRMSVTDAGRARHPEKAWREPVATPRKPQWIRAKAPGSPDYQATRKLVRKAGLTTVCEEAACPNIGECWSNKHVTVMILGEICTRGCTFCNVTTGKPGPVDPGEPERLAAAIRDLELNHVVITSVDRDDLGDGGAGHFVACIEHVRRTSPTTSIEILTPDFLRKPGAVERIVEARPDVFNHNLETVPRLYREVRPGSRYFTSLNLLWRVKELDSGIFTKSGLMVGLGETREEVLQVMDDMRQADVDFLTVGQYLQPTPRHHPIDRFWTPSEFEELAKIAWAKGFLMVSASPLTRSSHHADRDFRAMQARRQANGR